LALGTEVWRIRHYGGTKFVVGKTFSMTARVFPSARPCALDCVAVKKISFVEILDAINGHWTTG